MYSHSSRLETVQGIVEHGMVALLHDFGDGGLRRETLVLEVLLGIVDAVLVFDGVGVGSDPDKDFMLNIQNKDIVRIQETAVDLRTRSLLCEFELSAGVAQAFFLLSQK